MQTSGAHTPLPRSTPLFRLADRLLRPTSALRGAVSLSLTTAVLSVTVCSIVYLATGLRATDATTTIAMYGLPFILPFIVGTAIFLQFFRVSGALRARTRQLENEVERRVEAEQKLAILANIDDLTQLANRRSFFSEADSIAQAESPAYVVVIDLDDFKAVNDTYGHATGDEVLRELGPTLRRCFPAEAIVGRLGGEEFGVILGHGPIQKLTHTLDTARTAIHDVRPGLTASFGASDWLPAKDDSIDAAIARADVALYRAKQRGRDRIEILLRDDTGGETGLSDLAPIARRR